MRVRGFDIDRADLFLPGTIVLLILLAALGGDTLRLAARYQRSAVLDGQYWRLLSGHLVHLGWSHTLLNLAGLVLVWTLFAPALRGWCGLVIVLAAIAAIDAGFLLNEPGLGWYVGFSGVLHGLFAAGCVAGIAAGEREAWVLAALLAAKLVWGQMFGPIPLTEAAAGGPVVESAHLYGALGGLCAQLAAVRLRARQL
jgi:rhomboid family GlyGly-CTERM serine protease